MAEESSVEQHQASLPGASRTSLTEWAQQYSVEATPLGRGSFASVYRGVNRTTREPVAIKVMTKARLGEKALQMLAAEINILRTLEHPNVVCLRDSHTTERRILIVLEFCGGGDLGQFIQSRGPSPEPTARHFMLQLAAGLAFLQSRRLIHRDIKPQNLLLDENSPRAVLKIADFGLARHLPQGSLAESMLGSPLYMAPEVLNNRAYDAKADLWSAGAVLYELLTAKHPFGGANQNELIKNIRRNRPRLPPGVTLSPECRELLSMLLVPRPSERASLQAFQLCSFLNPDHSGASPSPSRGKASGTHGGVDGSGGNKQPASPASLPPMGRAFDASARAPQTSSKVLGSNSPCWSVEMKRERDRDPVETSAATTAVVVGDEQRRTVMGGAPPGQTRSEGETDGSVGGEVEDEKQRHRGYVNVGVRDGLWGWNWGGQGAIGVGVGGHEGCAIADEGPLPALPALPFALGPLGVPGPTGGVGEDETGHHDETGGVFDDVFDGVSNGGGGGGQLAPDFALDLAFAASPLDDLSVPEKKVGFEISRQRGDMVAASNVAASSAIAAPSLVSQSRPRSRSFPEQGAAKSGERTGRLNTFSTSPDSHMVPNRRGSGILSSEGDDRTGGAGSVDVPEPVFYLGKEGSVPGPSVSPAHLRPSVFSRRAPSEPTGSSTPSSYLSADGAGGGSGGRAGVDMRAIHTSSSGSPPGDFSGACTYVLPVSDDDHFAEFSQKSQPLPLPPAFVDAIQPQQRQKQQLSVGLLGGTGIGGSSGGGSVAPPDGGVPMVTKYPSLGSVGDSLLTIPEDSTGFVLVTRPSSSISCEHGLGCECWAWCAGGGATAGGGGPGTIRSPSASYFKAVNPYGGPAKAAAAASAERRSGPGAFLGSVGNIWNTAMNTFRGVAGAHGRRSSLPATRTGRASQQQQRRCSSPNVSVKLAGGSAAAAVSGGITPATAVAVGALGASPLASPRDNLSPVSTHSRKIGGGPGSSSGNCSGASISSGGASRGSHGTRVVGVGAGVSSRGGSRNTLYNQDASTFADSSSDHGPDVLYADDTAGHQPPPPRSREVDYPSQLIHHRRHSDPIPHRPHPAETETIGADAGIGASVGIGGGELSTKGCGGRARFCKPSEEADYRRTMAAADRAEVVGKRSILIVTLADKTAQEAMSLALESPRDARAAEPRSQQWPVHLRMGVGPAVGSGELGSADRSAGENANARRRHDMLTEALALYVRALAILRGALPGILVECEGVRMEGLAVRNNLSVDPAHPSQQQRFYRYSQHYSPQQCPPQQQQHKQNQWQKEQQQQQRVGRPSPPSPALMALRSALASKASWLKELFSQTLLRAEHCREQAAAASSAAAAAAPSHTSAHATEQPMVQSALRPHSSPPPGPTFHLLSKDSGRLTFPSDTASAAVFRSAMEHGQEATVCFMLGRSDAAVAHYVRACALLHLLALEPDMSGVHEDALCSVGDGSVGGGDVKSGRGADGKSQQGHEQQISSGWQAQLLMMADGYARHVESITGGDGKKREEREGAVNVTSGRAGDGKEESSPGFMHMAS